jgi:hypothetical protein
MSFFSEHHQKEIGITAVHLANFPISWKLQLNSITAKATIFGAASNNCHKQADYQ